MRAWDSVTQGGSLRPGPAALTILLIGLLLSLASVSQRIETAIYDLLVLASDSPGSGDVVLVDTRDLGRPGDTVWDAERFPDLLNALRVAGARLVLPVEPAPLTAALPDPAQLAALAEMERRSRADAPSGRANVSESFGQQLSAMRRRSELHARTLQAARAMRNLVVAVPTFDGGRPPSATLGTCDRHLFAGIEAAGRLDDIGMRRVRAVGPPPESLCPAVLAAGHVEFWPDEDGVVRRADLMVNASGEMVPAAALRAVLALSFPGNRPPTVAPDAITWEGHEVPTTAGARALLRFYSGSKPEAAFGTVRAQDLLKPGAAARLVAGRVVVLGHAQALEGEPGYASPVGERTSTALLTATVLSNLLQQDALARPAWMGWVETAVLVLLGIAALLWGARLPPALALMAGLSVALALLAVEGYLLLARGVWAELGTPAAFAILSLASMWFLHATRASSPVLTPAMAGGAPPVAPVAGRATSPEDELDLAFSMLRQQPTSERVKQRLYDIALEHARRRDLAKAERVLRHLAGIDPDYRNSGEKLKKLAGLRQNAPAAPASPEPRQAPPLIMPAPQPANLSGQTIGRYQIEQPIGRGAMATVYLGRDPKINRRVAIKTIALAEEFGDSDLANARTQFLREAESAGRLNHPNIISIYDAGEDGAVAYLAMEYFPGKPLSFYAQQGELLPPATVFDLMARAAEALHYAHSQHVVHRDVKPANLLYDADTDALKITDFGIARLTDSSRTKTGIILGTPSYMSPEQLAGTNVSGQSDLFSLGITLYQLLAGVPPFRADSIPKLMQKIAHDRHPPLCELRPDLPACVDALLDRALAKDPEDRFPNGRAMALALRDCCSSFAASPAVASP